MEPIGTQKIVDKNGMLQMQEDLINYLPDDSLISHPVTFDADTKNFLYYNHVSQDKKPAELFVSNNPYWLKFGLALQGNLSVGPDIIKVSHDLKTMTIALHTKDHHVAFVTNGVPHVFPYSTYSDILFCNNDNTYAFLGEKDNTNMVALIIGGVQVAAAENIHQFALSEDCKKFAYIVQDKIGDYLYFNGEKSDRYDRIENPTYSPDDKHFAYTTIRGNTVSLVKDGVLQKDQYISVFSLMYSKDSRHLSYVADKIVNNVLHESVWVDGEKYGDYDEIKTPVFSPDNKHILYVGREISHEYAHLVLDNDELATVSGLFDSLGFAQFSPNGRHAIVQVMHYRSKDDFDHSIYFGSAIGRLWHSKDHEKILSSTVTFSKDGNFVEYAAQSGRKLLWVTERIPK